VLPFDTKDERIIELGEYSASGLTYVQGEQAKAALRESLEIVLANDYSPPSPLREAAANRSVEQLAPENPLAAEMTQMRETLDDIRRELSRRTLVPQSVLNDIKTLREAVRRNIEFLDNGDFEILSTPETTDGQNRWVTELHDEWLNRLERRTSRQRKREEYSSSDEAEYSDEPPF